MTQAGRPAVFVSVDMEGCATLVHWDEVRPSTDVGYNRARRIMTDEVNAVLAGAFEAGAVKALVNDSHAFMRNLIIDEVDARATVVSGRFKPEFMLEGIGPHFDAALFVGYHGAIGDSRAVMAHTYSPRVIYECRLNGEPVGEITINAALAGEYGVPVALVSGDRTTLAEARRNLPWAVAVEIKESLSYYAANSLSPAAASAALRAGGRAALASLPKCHALKIPAPIDMEIDTLKTSQADALEWLPGFARRGPRTLAFAAEAFSAVYRALMAAVYLGAAAEGR